MKNSNDLRVRKTNKALMDALVALLSEKNFEDITIGELCDRAMVRRATFYQHFSGKQELFSYLIDQVGKYFEQEFYKSYDSNATPEEFYICMLDCCFRATETQRDLIRSIVRCNNGDHLFRVIFNNYSAALTARLLQDVAEGAEYSAPPELISVMLNGALISTVLWWISSDEPISREELTKTFSSLVMNF